MSASKSNTAPRVPRRVRTDWRVRVEISGRGHLVVDRLVVASLCANRAPLWEWRMVKAIGVTP